MRCHKCHRRKSHHHKKHHHKHHKPCHACCGTILPLLGLDRPFMGSAPVLIQPALFGNVSEPLINVPQAEQLLHAFDGTRC